MYFSFSLLLVLVASPPTLARKCHRKGGYQQSNPVTIITYTSAEPAQAAQGYVQQNPPASVQSAANLQSAASTPTSSTVAAAASTTPASNLGSTTSTPAPASSTAALVSSTTSAAASTPTPSAPLAAAADIKTVAQKTLEGISTLESKEQQFGNMAASLDAGQRLIVQIKILTTPGLTQADLTTCIAALQKIDADGKEAEAAKRAEAGTNLGGVLAELRAAQADYRQRGPQPDMNPSKALLQGVIN